MSFKMVVVMIVFFWLGLIQLGMLDDYVFVVKGFMMLELLYFVFDEFIVEINGVIFYQEQMMNVI